MSEETDLLSRISQVAGQINLHKEQLSSVQNPQTSMSMFPPPRLIPTDIGRADPNFPGRISRNHRYSGGRARGGRQGVAGRIPRSRSIILNGHDARHPKELDEPKIPTKVENSQVLNDEKESADVTSWISKRDRHMQLIHTSVYDKQARSRTKAIEHSRQQKILRQDFRERQKINNHLKLISTGRIANTSKSEHLLNVNGINFHLSKGGSKLTRERHSMRQTPKFAVIAGVKFFRSKNGNLYRSGLIKSQRQLVPIQKLDAPCIRFSNTGQCLLGPHCAYIHDHSKVAICRVFLKSGNCPKGPYCDLSHEPTYERVPACSHFLRGRCSKSDCRYAHVQVNLGAEICRAFTTLGHCHQGPLCDQRHVFECPDYSNTGNCRNSDCRMPHIDRAGQLRQQAAIWNEDHEKDDISSEEADDVGSDKDDIDSDGLDGLDNEMLLGDVDNHETRLSQQDDFVRFR